MISELSISKSFFDNNDIKIKEKVHGFKLAKLLPFDTTTESKDTIQPMDKSLVNRIRFDTDFKCLFTSQHLQVALNYLFFFFGSRGVKEDNLNAHPVQNSLSCSFKESDHDNQSFYLEKQRTGGLEGEKWTTKINIAKQRLAKLRHTFKKDETLEENVPGKRLSPFEPIIEHLFFSNDTSIYLEDVRNKSPDAFTAGQSVCSLICNTLKKVLASEKNRYHIIAYQIYFCILADDVIKYARYIKSTRALCPSEYFSSSNALHLNSIALYQLLTQTLDQEQSEQPSNSNKKKEIV
ncbi:hypothetical protein F4703DRAFT_1789842 [Phycomyces blakesleeanus]